MKCPGCSSDLDSPPASAAPAPLRCPRCRGMWLDREVLEGEHAGIWSNLPAMGVDAMDAMGDAVCPRCALTLTAVCPHDHPELRIDRCASCHGLWLDNGELEKLQAILAGYEDHQAPPAERPGHWSPMKWVMYRSFERWKHTRYEE